MNYSEGMIKDEKDRLMVYLLDCVNDVDLEIRAKERSYNIFSTSRKNTKSVKM